MRWEWEVVGVRSGRGDVLSTLCSGFNKAAGRRRRRRDVIVVRTNDDIERKAYVCCSAYINKVYISSISIYSDGRHGNRVSPFRQNSDINMSVASALAINRHRRINYHPIMQRYTWRIYAWRRWRCSQHTEVVPVWQTRIELQRVETG